jgi:hypothetical protein
MARRIVCVQRYLRTPVQEKKKGSFTMTNQPENEMQQNMTPDDVRQQLLAEIEAGKQAITELSDEDLEAVAGGHWWNKVEHFVEDVAPIAITAASMFRR